jgi:aspartate aminotransferase
MGAFYLLPNVEAYFGKKTVSGTLIKDADDLCLELLKEEKVAMVSGDAFGAPKCIRLSYATSTDIIEQSLDRLKKFLLRLS